jgi:transposase
MVVLIYIKNNSVFSIKDEAGVVIARRKLANDIKKNCLFLDPFKPQLKGLVVESTFNWY